MRNFFRGFSLIEVLMAITILVIIAGLSYPSLKRFQKENDLKGASEEIISLLRLASAKTLASESASSYGVFFDNSSSPNRSILFKGASYAGRDQDFDEIRSLPRSVEISSIDLVEGAEVIFKRITGNTDDYGSISLWLSLDHALAEEIYIDASGGIGYDAVSVPSGSSQLVDSRHVHFDYSRFIDTPAEILTLNFEGGIVQQITIADNIVDGEIYWEGEVMVSGINQKIKIHTHHLNNPDTQFCIHRGREDNNKAFDLSISGDGTGNIISYSADGATVTSSSIYASGMVWQ